MLALDVQTLKMKEELAKPRTGNEDDLSKIHKDNRWLIEQVENLVH